MLYILKTMLRGLLVVMLSLVSMLSIVAAYTHFSNLLIATGLMVLCEFVYMLMLVFCGGGCLFLLGLAWTNSMEDQL